MPPHRRRPHRHSFTTWLAPSAIVLVTVACGGGDPGPTPLPPVPAIALTTSVAELTLVTQGSASVPFTVARSGGFTGSVNMSVSDLPTGVSATFVPATLQTNETSGTLTLNAAPTIQAGTRVISLSAAGAGNISSSKTLSVTTRVPTVTVTLNTATATIARGSSASLTGSLTRSDGFAGAMSFSVSGLPAGISATVSPAATTGSAVTLQLTVGATVTVGSYTGTLIGTADGLPNSTTPFTVIVAPGAGDTSIRWVFCDATRVPVFFVVRDGRSGAWQRIFATGDSVFSFTMTQAVGTVAYVQLNAGSRRNEPIARTNTNVFQRNAQEMKAASELECALNPARARTINGTVAGVSAGGFAYVTLGQTDQVLNDVTSNFMLRDVAPGSPSLLAGRYRFDTGAGAFVPDRFIVRRAVNNPSGSTLPVLDFGSTEGFAPATATVSIENLGGDLAYLESKYNQPGDVFHSLAISALSNATTRVQYGIPAAQLVTGDLQHPLVVARGADNSTRWVASYRRLAVDQTVRLGARVNDATVTKVVSDVVRPRARGTVQNDYPNMWVAFTQGGDVRAYFVEETAGYRQGATTYDLEVPDLSGVPGFNAQWGLGVGTLTQYLLTGTSTPADMAIADGSVWVLGNRIGVVP